MQVIRKDKNVNLDLFGWLTSAEYNCNCGRSNCWYTLVDDRLVNAFVKTRHQFSAPIIINSGFRCVPYNRFINGSSTYSKHCIGHAIDIRPLKKDSLKIETLEHIAKQYFDYVKWYQEDGFIHCHMDLID